MDEPTPLPPHIAELPVVERFAALMDSLCALVMAELAPRTWWGALFAAVSRPVAERLCAELRAMRDRFRALAAQVSAGDADRTAGSGVRESAAPERACPADGAGRGTRERSATPPDGEMAPPDLAQPAGDSALPRPRAGAVPDSPRQRRAATPDLRRRSRPARATPRRGARYGVHVRASVAIAAGSPRPQRPVHNDAFAAGRHRGCIFFSTDAGRPFCATISLRLRNKIRLQPTAAEAPRAAVMGCSPSCRGIAEGSRAPPALSSARPQDPSQSPGAPSWSRTSA